MSLSELKVPTETFQVGEASLSVRGLGASDLGYFIEKHKDSLSVIGDSFQSAQEEGNDMESIAVNLAKNIPELFDTIIACAMDERGAEEKVRLIPFPVSLAMIKAIGELTFEAYGGVKPFTENLITIIRSSKDAINDVLNEQ